MTATATANAPPAEPRAAARGWSGMDTRPRILAKFCELVEFSPTEAQMGVLRWMLAPRGAVIDDEHPVKSELLWLAGRGSGKSTLAVLAGLFAAGVGNAHVLLTSPSLDLSASVLMGYARRHASP